MTPLDHKVGQLQAMLAGLDKVVVCFSGGVDSAYLLAEAVGVLGEQATALTAVSPSLATEEGADARRLERYRCAPRPVRRSSSTTRSYAANPANAISARSKCTAARWPRRASSARRTSSTDSTGTTTGGRACRRRASSGCARHSTRPGSRRPTSGRRRGAWTSPVWDKPALACLSSRFPYGTEVTPARLTQVAACERVLRAHGFRVYGCATSDRWSASRWRRRKWLACASRRCWPT